MCGNGGKVGVRVHEIEGEFSLGKKFGPVVNWEGWVSGREEAEKVPSECLDSTFRGIRTFLVRWDGVVDNV
jgi:hypothetical protein